MQIEIDALVPEFDVLWFFFTILMVILLAISWHLMERTGAMMTQQRYSATYVVVSALISPLAMVLPLVVMVILHPGYLTVFVGYLIVARWYYFVALLFYVLAAMIGGWNYARAYPVEQTPEKQSGSHPELTEKPGSS